MRFSHAAGSAQNFPKIPFGLLSQRSNAAAFAGERERVMAR
jgi:hypothetical protein